MRRGATLLGLVVASAVAACGAENPPAPAPATSVPPPQAARPAPSSTSDPTTPAVRRSSIEAVARWVVETMYSANTSVDPGPNAAARRAVPLLTTEFAEGVLNSPPLRAPGAQWNTWAARKVRLEPKIRAITDDRPTDSAKQAYRIYEVTQIPKAADCATLAPVVVTVYVLLRKGADGWAVQSVDER